MQKALGTSPEDEAEENLHHLSKYLTGLCGLMFTNKSEKEIVDFFNKFEGTCAICVSVQHIDVLTTTF